MKISILNFFLFIFFAFNSYCDEVPFTDGEIISGMVIGFVSEVLDNSKLNGETEAAVIFENGHRPTDAMIKKIESLLTAHGFTVIANQDSAIVIFVKITDIIVAVVNERDVCARDIKLRMHVRLKDVCGEIRYAEARNMENKDILPEGLLKTLGDSGFYFNDVNVTVPREDRKNIRVLSFAVIISTLFWFALNV